MNIKPEVRLIQETSVSNEAPKIQVFLKDKVTGRLIAAYLDPDDYFKNYEPHFRAADEARRKADNDNPPKPKAAPVNRKGKPKLRIVQAGEWLHDWKPQQSLINGLFRRKYVYSLTAPAGSGKTAVALTIAATVAEGRDLGDHVTHKGRVLYLAGENAEDVMERLHVMAETMRFDLASLPLDFLPFVGGMDDIKATIRVTGHSYSLLIVDTSQAYFSGDDFNDNRAAKDWAQELRTLTELRGGPAVVVLSHPPKSADHGPFMPFGGSTFRNEIDGNAYLDRHDNIVLLTRDPLKFRGAQFEPLAFKLEVVTSLQTMDADGNPLMTVVAWPLTQAEYAETRDSGKGLSAAQAVVLKAITDEGGLSLQTYADRVGLTKGQVQTALNALVKRGLVEKREGDKPWAVAV